MRTFQTLTATLLLALPAARAAVTLSQNPTQNTWTLENDFLRVSVDSNGRVPLLIKKTGASAGTNQAAPGYAAFLDRVNEQSATGQTFSANPDGDDSTDKRSLRVSETIDTGAGVVFSVTKTYLLRDGDRALEVELSFRNTSDTDWIAMDPHKGAESLVYVAPGGAAPAGDVVQARADDGPDVAGDSGTTWWGTGAVPRRPLTQGFLAALDTDTGVMNTLLWDHGEQTTNSREGATAVSVYRGSNRFQLEAWRTRFPVGQTVTWKQYLLVDEGIPFVSFAGYGSLVGGVSLNAPMYAAGEPAVAVFRLNSTRRTGAVYSLRALRLLAPDGSILATASDIGGITLPAGGRTARGAVFTIPTSAGNGAYSVTADLFEGETRLGSLLSAPVNIAAQVSPDRGDVNGDGSVDTADAALCASIAGGLSNTDTETISRADLDGDGRVTLLDAALIKPRMQAISLPDQVLTILHTNDMHGHVLSDSNMDATGPGGLSRLNSLAHPIRQEMPNVLFLDAGDNAQATATEFYNRGQTMFAAMNRVGFDASTLGNHEFDWGQGQTARLIGQARFPMLSANVRDTRTGEVYGGAREYALFRRGPLTIAVFGLTTLDTVSIEWPPTLSHIRFEDPTETARRLVPELRSKADLVIAVTHLGFTADKALAAAVPGIDVIVGGHSHTTLAEHVWVGNTVIAQTGSYARNLGRIDLLLNKAGDHWSVAGVNGKGGDWWADRPNPPLGALYPRTALLPVGANLVQDPSVADAYRGPFNTVQTILNTQVGNVPAAISGNGSSSTPRPLPATLAELLRRRVGADVGLMSALSATLPAGDATVRSVYNVYGGYTRQNVVLVRATGAAIRSAVTAAYSTTGAYPAYFGGLGGTVARKGDTVEWRNPTVNGVPLDDGRYYLVTSGSYPLMNYPGLRDSPMVSDQIGWVKPLLAEEMLATGTITPYAGLILP